jgi:uncharacterized membrane protein
MGVLASAVGAGFIAVIGMVIGPGPGLWAVPVVLPAGLGGSILDSVLGATVQCVYLCPTDGSETEQYPLHHCGSATVYLRGWRWLNNDWVNAWCGGLGSVLSCILALALGA